MMVGALGRGNYRFVRPPTKRNNGIRMNFHESRTVKVFIGSKWDSSRVKTRDSLEILIRPLSGIGSAKETRVRAWGLWHWPRHL